MGTKVTVIGNEAGQVINVSENNPEFGYVRVQQTRTMFDDNGFLRARKVFALIPGKVEELEMANFRAGQELQGQIIVKEALGHSSINTTQIYTHLVNDELEQAMKNLREKE